tara:strand:+ start:702 stop:875 length:174 start_codon:yes stop_codon:yes gene_type:complete
MKVKDLIENLKSMNPEDEIVLKHLYTDPPIVMKSIRVYNWSGRVYIDGFNQEKKNES